MAGIVKTRIEKLNEREINTLKVMFNGGGYFTQKHINALYPNISNKSNWVVMKKLVELDFIKEFDNDIGENTRLYQVKSATCKLMNNPDSYFRKRHSESYIKRALVKGYFVSSNFDKLYSSMIFDNEDKINFLMDKGFNRSILPTKKNYNTKSKIFDDMIHIEEVLIDFTECKGRKITFNDEVIFDDSTPKIVVCYIDKNISSAKEMFALLRDYEGMIRSNVIPVEFLVVSSDIKKSISFERIKDRIVNQVLGESDPGYDEHLKDKIEIDIVKRYCQVRGSYIKNILGEDGKLEELKKHTNDGTLYKELIKKQEQMPLSFLTNEDKDIIENFSKKAYNYIDETIKQYIKFKDKDGYISAIKFINNVMRLDYYGCLDNNKISSKTKIKNYYIDVNFYSYF